MAEWRCTVVIVYVTYYKSLEIQLTFTPYCCSDLVYITSTGAAGLDKEAVTECRGKKISKKSISLASSPPLGAIVLSLSLIDQ